MTIGELLPLVVWASPLVVLLVIFVVACIEERRAPYEAPRCLIPPRDLGAGLDEHRDLAARLAEDAQVAALEAAWDLPPAPGSFRDAA